MRHTLEWLGFIASFATAAFLRLVPLEWLAVALSAAAITLSSFAFYKVARVVRQLEEATQAQAETVGELTERAEAVQQKIVDE